MSAAAEFESAVEAVISGDLADLERLLAEHQRLVHDRSPLAHRATLLHYVAANGVEDRRQKTPPNAVEIARLLLEAGAEADALASMYDGQYPTLSMLVSSSHPARAGLQVPLVDLLLDFGAAVEGRGSGRWVSPLMTALAFGYLDAAQALVRRGARVDTLAAAAGLGLFDEARRLLPSADPLTRHRALALAAQHGHTAILALLLDAGEDPNRYNPEGNHAHSTPLHQAVWSNNLDSVQLLVTRGARLDLRDTIHHGTPLGWAEYGGRTEIAAYLRGVTNRATLPGMALPEDNTARMQTLDDGWNAQDVEKVAGFHKPDVVVYWPGQPPTRGMDAHRAEALAFFKTFPDQHLDNRPYKTLFGSGEWTCSIAHFTGTMQGTMQGADGKEIPPTGKSFEVDFCTVAHWDNGQITHEYLFYDLVTFMKQIGLSQE